MFSMCTHLLCQLWEVIHVPLVITPRMYDYKILFGKKQPAVKHEKHFEKCFHSKEILFRERDAENVKSWKHECRNVFILYRGLLVFQLQIISSCVYMYIPQIFQRYIVSQKCYHFFIIQMKFSQGVFILYLPVHSVEFELRLLIFLMHQHEFFSI